MKTIAPNYHVGYALNMSGPPITVVSIVPLDDGRYSVGLDNGNSYVVPASWVREDAKVSS